VASPGSPAASVPGASVRPAFGDLLSTVAVVERSAGSWRRDPNTHPNGESPSGHVIPVADYRISSFFMNTDPAHTGGVHSGVDFATEMGRPIVSVSSGKVVHSGFLGNAGNAVIVKDHRGYLVLYGHMSVIQARKGQQVRPGDRIGLVGSTGHSTGPHLHLQVSAPKGSLVDPVTWLGFGHREVKEYGHR
jgi:murein DD-endopeptidase MepM/ murein hydrolase activator NlpD